jgi:hypothetical protein
VVKFIARVAGQSEPPATAHSYSRLEKNRWGEMRAYAIEGRRGSFAGHSPTPLGGVSGPARARRSRNDAHARGALGVVVWLQHFRDGGASPRHFKEGHDSHTTDVVRKR